MKTLFTSLFVSPLVSVCPSRIGLSALVMTLLSGIIGSPVSMATESALDDQAQDDPDVASKAVTVDFGSDVLPILAKNCIACHNSKSAEGGLNLESHELLIQGGDSGLAIDTKNARQSLLLQRINDPDEPMPPDDNEVGAEKLTDAEQSMLARWITAGALPPTKPTTKIPKLENVPVQLRSVYAIAASRDGLQLAFGSGNRAVVVSGDWTTEAPQRRQILHDRSIPASEAGPTTHHDLVQSIAFSFDSQRIATGGFRNVKIWRRQTDPTLLLRGLTQNAASAKFSENGRHIAILSENQTLEITDLRTKQSHRFLDSVEDVRFAAITWLKDTTQLLACDQAGQLTLIDASDLTRRAIAGSDSDQILVGLCSVSADLAFGLTSNGQLVAIRRSQTDGPATFNRQQVPIQVQVAALSRSTSPEELLVADVKGNILRLNTADYQTTQLLKSDVPVSQLHRSPDGQLIVTLDRNGRASLWRADDATQIADLTGDYLLDNEIREVTLQQERQQGLVKYQVDRVPELQSAADKEKEALAKVKEARDKAAMALSKQVEKIQQSDQAVVDARRQLTEAEAKLAEAQKAVEAAKVALEKQEKSAEAAVAEKAAAEAELAKRDQALAAAQDGARRAESKIPALNKLIEVEKARLSEIKKHATRLQQQAQVVPPLDDVKFVADGARIVAKRSDGTTQLFGTDNGKPTGRLAAPEQHVVCLGIDSNSRPLGLSRDGRLLSWDPELPWHLERQIGSVSEALISDRATALDFSPDGKRLAIGSGPPSRFGDLTMINVSDGSIVLPSLQIHSDTVLGLQYAPDGQVLATGGADKVCRLLSTSGEVLRTLEGHTHHILSVAWRDDQRVLATGSADGSVKLWDSDTGKQLRTINVSTKEVTSVEFVAQSKQLVVGCIDGAVRLYDSESGKLLRSFGDGKAARFAVQSTFDGTVLMAGLPTGALDAWLAKDGKALWQLSPDADPELHPAD